MKKEDFIMETEDWLVRQDVSDFVCKVSTARKKNIMDYLEQTESILKWKLLIYWMTSMNELKMHILEVLLNLSKRNVIRKGSDWSLLSFWDI